MATTPNSFISVQNVRGACVALSTTANTNLTAPTSVTQVMVAGVNGARVVKLKAIPCATVTATQLQVFRSTDGGTTKRYSHSVLMPAYTLSQTTANNPTDFGYNDITPLILDPNERLYIGVGVGSVQINAEVEWGDY